MLGIWEAEITGNKPQRTLFRYIVSKIELFQFAWPNHGVSCCQPTDHMHLAVKLIYTCANMVLEGFS